MTKKLSYADGTGFKVEFGSLIIGDGIETLVDDTWYAVKSVKASGSALPTNLEAKYVFRGDAGIVPEVGDDVYPITLTELCDIQNWSMDFSKDEIEVTTLCDLLKNYLAGRSDLSGTLEGITTLGITDEADGFITKFIDKVKQVADLSSVTLTKANNTKIFLKLDINKENQVGDTEVHATYFMPVIITSFTAGVNNGEAQTFTSAFRTASNDFLVPHLYENEQPIT